MSGQAGKYHVRKWDRDEVVSSHAHLVSAKAAARAMGHTGTSRHRIFIDPLPVAYVANEEGECIYNPRFFKEDL